MENKSCGQVSIPSVDNTNPCTSFTPSGCLIVNRISPYVKNLPGENLDDYLIKMEGLIKRQELRIKILETIVKNLTINTPTP